MTDKLRLDYINSLPQPFMVRLGSRTETWPLHMIDVETGLLQLDICGKLQNGHIGEVSEFIDLNGKSHDPETFYTDYIED